MDYILYGEEKNEVPYSYLQMSLKQQFETSMSTPTQSLERSSIILDNSSEGEHQIISNQSNQNVNIQLAHAGNLPGQASIDPPIMYKLPDLIGTQSLEGGYIEDLSEYLK